MIATLMTVRLHAAPERKTSRAGKEYITASCYSQAADGGRVWAKVTAFNAEAAAALLNLRAGDACAILGTATVRAYTSKQGEPAASLDLVADQVLTLYALTQRRKQAARSPAAPEFEDALPDRWEG